MTPAASFARPEKMEKTVPDRKTRETPRGGLLSELRAERSRRQQRACQR